jgi:hypothetical protein
MKWSRARTLAAGLGLIALTNAVALLGVAWNRSGEPQALLQFTQRELQVPYAGEFRRENSGLALEMQWRVLDREPEQADFNAWQYPRAGGSPEWLDKAKLQALGFDAAKADALEDYRRHDRQLPREALLVLELDGPAWQRLRERVARMAARAEASATVAPADKGVVARAKSAREALERENASNSRLFIVDAGLDAAALRAKYPDTRRYAIVSGHIRLAHYGRAGSVQGYVDSLAVSSMNVPHRLRPVFEGLQRTGAAAEPGGVPFEVSVAFGQRMEPWIAGATRK